MFTVEAGISLSVTAAVFLLLMFKRGTPVEFLFLAGMIVLTLFGIITPEEALSGFSTPAVITIGELASVAL